MRVPSVPNELLAVFKNNIHYIVSSIFAAGASYGIDLVVFDQYLTIVGKLAALLVACLTVVKLIRDFKKPKQQ